MPGVDGALELVGVDVLFPLDVAVGVLVCVISRHPDGGEVLGLTEGLAVGCTVKVCVSTRIKDNLRITDGLSKEVLGCLGEHGPGNDDELVPKVLGLLVDGVVGTDIFNPVLGNSVEYPAVGKLVGESCKAFAQVR